MFQHLEITDTDAKLNFDIHIDPTRRMHCFIGENGVGKTVFLESLAQIFWGGHTIWRGADFPGGQPSWATAVWRPPFTDSIRSTSLRVPNGTVDQTSLKGMDVWSNTSLGRVVGIPNLQYAINQPLCYIHAQERSSLRNIGPAALSLVGSAEQIFADTIKRGILATQRAPEDNTSVATWIASRLLINPAFVNGQVPADYEVLALLRLLQRFDPQAFGGLVVEENGKPKMNIHYADGQLLFLGRPIDKLASGWTALVRILQEIIATLSAWERMVGSTDILNSKAIILIDEIDAHLHPRWQDRLVPFLKESFPNATFFITTHSPLVVRDTEPGEAHELVLEGTKVHSRRLGSPKDWYFSDVLAQAFHVELPVPGSEGSPPLTQLLIRYAAKVHDYSGGRGGKEEGLALYQQIQDRLVADDPRRGTVEQLRRILG